MEKERLIQFRKNLSDALKPDVTDAVLLKWLRVTNFNLRKSEQLYREHKWTIDVYQAGEGHDTVYRWPKVVEKFNFSNPLGTAKDGSPVHYIALGRGDLKGFLNSVDMLDIGKYCSDVIEAELRRCREQSRKLGKDINEIVFIVDMDKFSLRQVFFHGVVESGFDLFQILQDQYPEIWNQILVINVPPYFQTVFNIFKPIFRHTFVQKIFAATRDRSANLLLKYIDREELPAFLGGEQIDSYGDGMCREFMKFGGIIPEEYYIRNVRPPLQPTDPGVEDVWLGPKGFYNFVFFSWEPNARVTVEVRTEGGSVGAKMLYKEMDADSERLDIPKSDEYIDESAENSPWKRVSPYCHLPGHISSIDNHCYAPWPGLYVYRFDNSWNWITSRRLIVRIKVLPKGTSPS